MAPPKKTVKKPEKPVIKAGWNFRALNQDRLFSKTSMKLVGRELDKNKKPTLVEKTIQSATAAEDGKMVRNTQQPAIEVKRKVNLIHYVQDPLTSADKILLENAARRSMPVRNSLKVREQAAYKKQKLVVDLPQEIKDILSEKEIKEKVETLKNNEKIKKIIQKFGTLDKNVGLPTKLKVLAKQSWIFGRNLIIVLFEDEEFTKIKELKTINSRRLGDPILNEEEDLKFEGVVVDGEGLSKDSMIYATYDESEYSPHTAHFGYPPLETVMHVAEAHNIAIEEDIKEIMKSAWLPSILLPIDTTNLKETDKNTRVTTIIDGINPGKIIGVSSDVQEPIMLDLKPDFNGVVAMVDSQEIKIYNAFQVPLFLVKSDEIANRATANKSAQLFLDGIVADDQQWMEDLLGEQWYDPLLREELQDDNELLKSLDDSEEGEEADDSVDTDAPEGTDAPLPFVIRRRFEKMTVEELVDLADAIVKLKQNDIWDTEQSNKALGTEEVTPRIIKEREEREKKMKEQGIIPPGGPGQKGGNQPPFTNEKKPDEPPSS